jgi:hypothetical protein
MARLVGRRTDAGPARPADSQVPLQQPDCCWSRQISDGITRNPSMPFHHFACLRFRCSAPRPPDTDRINPTRLMSMHGENSIIGGKSDPVAVTHLVVFFLICEQYFRGLRWQEHLSYASYCTYQPVGNPTYLTCNGRSKTVCKYPATTTSFIDRLWMHDAPI